MALDFTETLTLTVPDIGEQLAAFSEADYGQGHGLIIEIAAIHEGITANYNHYSESALKESLASWTSPYPKPIILNHDTSTEPIGRVMGAKLETEADGTPYVKLQVAIKDAEAIAKVMDGRYLTGSVGGKAEEAACSVCDADWAKASMFDLPCKHERGKTYKGKLAYLELGGLGFKEYSFVNVPADQRSTVRAVQTAAAEADEDDWVRPVHVFAMDMNKEEIVELSESGDRNILESLTKKDSAATYMKHKGAFLSTLVADLSDKKESEVADKTLLEEDEDILDVTDDLSADLAAADEDDEPEADPTPEDEDPEDEENDDVPEDPDAVLTAEDPEDPDTEEDEDEEADQEADAEEAPAARPEGQEKPHSADPTDDLPPSREALQTAEGETDLNEAVETLESRVAELEAENQGFIETIANRDEVISRLKTALKRQLAERVVDTKIMLGLSEAADRADLLEDHVQRSASSLADTLRDLATMPIKPRETAKVDEIPTIDAAAGAVADDHAVDVGENGEVTQIPTIDPEQLFVDVLSGRRSL